MILAAALASASLLKALPMAAAAIRIQQERAVSSYPKFRGAGLKAQQTTAREWMLAGPAEAAKTYAACWRLDSFLRETPGARIVIARKVRKDMATTVLRTWERIIAIRGGVTPHGGVRRDSYEYGNGSRAFVVGMDRPGSVLSGEFDAAYVNQAEEFQVEDWETITTRVTGRGAITKTPMVFGDCNPGPPTHWIRHRPRLEIYEARHEDNPTLFDENGQITEQGKRTMETLDALTGVRKERLRFGRWVAAEGTVYEFDRRTHMVSRDVLHPSWRRFASVDFGFTNPFVWQLWAMDNDGRLYLEREIYRTKRIVEDHARHIKQVLASLGVSVEATITDHDAEDRATLERHGIPTRPAIKAVSVGIQAVSNRLKLAGDGKPRLFICEGALIERDEALAAARKPVCTADEFEVYSWPKDASGRALHEEPVKLNDHGMDGIRYAAMYADAGAAPADEADVYFEDLMYAGEAYS